MFTEKIENQRRLMREALKKLQEIEMWEESLSEVDEDFLAKKKMELAVEYGVTTTQLVREICDATGFELIEKLPLKIATA